MTKKRMNIVIASSLLLIYIICGSFTFKACYSLQANIFSNISNDIINNVSKNIDSIIFEEEDSAKSIEELCQQIGMNSGTLYPTFVGVFDKNGNAIIQSGEYIFSEETGLLYIGNYMTDDLITQYQKFDDELSSYPMISEMEYYTENGKIIPTKLQLISAERSIDSEKTHTLVLNNKNATDKITYSEDSPIEFIFPIEYEYNCINKKINNELQEKYSKENIKTLTSENDYSSGGGYYGSEEAERHSTFTFDGKEYYYFVINIKHSLIFDTLTSVSFKGNILNQTVLFLIIGIIIFFALNKIFDKNEKLNTAREAFTSAAAHELKTPITIINNQCECLLQNVAPEKRDEYVDIIYQQNKRMSHLVSSLLQYNRINENNLYIEKFDLAQVVYEELKKYDALLEEKGISIQISCSNSVISSDRRLIALVIDNFISNAIKHSDGKILVELKNNRFSVFNSGKQIKEEYKNGIWELFNRSYEESSEDNSTGMGLALSKKILELHNFKYGFENVKNGVEFFFIVK